MREEDELRCAFGEKDYETIFDITAENPQTQEEAKSIINEYLGENLI